MTDASSALTGVRRVMGSETEFGVLAPSAPEVESTALSAWVINAWAKRCGIDTGASAPRGGAGWDYAAESPLADARGFSMARADAHPSQLTDQPHVLSSEDIAAEGYREWAEADPDFDRRGTDPIIDGLLSNLVLTNGARFYVDHAHPEYSGPEVTNPLDAVCWDAAGDVVAQRAAEQIAAAGLPPVQLYKNNTDGKSVSYGTHENYLVPREVPFGALVAGLTPFFISRQVVCGAGRVGLGADGATPGYQLSQRADFFETEVGLETTIRRPIINTRDEPHAVAEKHRRLHVIIGDANLSQTANYLKFGTTALVLSMIEAGTVPALRVVDPVAALRTISHDPTLRATVTLTDGSAVTGLDLQRRYLDAAREHCARHGVDDAMTVDVLDTWQGVLDDLAVDPARTADRLDWTAKLGLLEAYRRRDGVDWDHPRLALVDLQYADLRPERGLYFRLLRAGRMRELVGADEIEAAAERPPSDTRAWFRGRCLEQFGEAVTGANWDSVVLEPSPGARPVRVPTREPLGATQELTEKLFTAAPPVGDFLQRLRAEPEVLLAPTHERSGTIEP